MPTVKDVTYELLRRLGLTIVVGNPGSTEETFLKNFPADFRYVLALQEASAVGIADGLAQGLRQPVLVNVHTGAGLSHAMGSMFSAYQNKTPLIITAGQQTREMLLLEPWLTNIDPDLLPRPWVKWSYQPARPQDIPAAFMRAYATAMQPPSGPVFLSLPLDDWDKPMDDVDVHRTVATRVGAEPERVRQFAERINASRTPVLVYGADLARSQAWETGVRFAERLNAPVWTAPYSESAPFPQTHPLHQGVLPDAIGPLSEKLSGHDLAIVVGAPVFRYYPYVAGPYLPSGTALLHVTDDPDLSAKAPVGDSLVADSLLFLEQIAPRVTQRKGPPPVASKPNRSAPDLERLPLSAAAVFSVIRPLCPDAFVLVTESASNESELLQHFPIDAPDTFYAVASGCLGWGMPAAVGHALAEQSRGRNRPVIAVIGDGSFQYSVQSIYTAVQQQAHVVFVVLKNGEYAILKEFALLEQTPGVPGLDLPGLDIVALGNGYGACSAHAETAAEIRQAFQEALAFKGTGVIEIPITTELRPLV